MLWNAAALATGVCSASPWWSQQGLDDPGVLRRDAERAKNLGFYGKGCVHPRRTSVINDVFTPTAEEINRAPRRRRHDGAVTAVNA
ncbi:citrate lyase beta subunit [Streptomyces sp. SAI-170]|uniref:hypothetical protein n=1 Tax=Streptomyces sp. SAI-170 TaxID=3377729 RepID=UPI003C7BD35F